VEKIQVSLKLDNNDWYFSWKSMYIYYISLKWEMFQKKRCREIKTQFCVLNFFSLKIFLLWDNVEKHCRAREITDDNLIRHMRLACWVTKATDTRSEYAIIIAVPWEQLLRQRASMLRSCAHCLSFWKSLRITNTVGSLPLICVY
jgi:hypothetical protein